MKYLFFSLLIAGAAYYYINSGDTEAEPIQVVKEEIAEPVPEVAVEKPIEEEPEEVVEPPSRMVQIHGKWYKYRRDNTYNVDGVPTLFIPQADVSKDSNPRVAKSKNEDSGELMMKPGDTQAKSQKLLNMADKNPLKVYSPSGFKTLKDGVDAAKNSQHDRAKAIEAATKGE